MNQPRPVNTPAALSELNQSRIVQYLHAEGVCSRAQLARHLHLTAPAVGKLVGRLIESGIISEVGEVSPGRHGRSIGLQLNAGQYQVIGVKFARSLVQIGTFDISGHLLDMEELPPLTDSDVRNCVVEVKRRIRVRLEQNPSIVAIGMAVPGPYLRKTGQIALVTSMQGWSGVNFITEFSQAFPVPTFIEQDARAGALAQSLFDPRIEGTSLAYYLVGEGVGLGVIDQGRLVRGSLGTATEIGHVSIDMNGNRCECGNYGCLESYCSAVAIHARMGGPDYQDLFPNQKRLTHKEACNLLFRMAESGNQRANQLLNQIIDYVGYGCITIVNAFNPAQIVIGDLIAGAGQGLLDGVRKLVTERALPRVGNQTEILLSQLPADATLTGAAAVAANQFLQHPSSLGLHRCPREDSPGQTIIHKEQNQAQVSRQEKRTA